jgi:hypothetical protein
VEFTLLVEESTVTQAIGKSGTFVGCQYCTESQALSTINQYEINTNQSCVVSQCAFGGPSPAGCFYDDSVRFTPYENNQALFGGGVFLIVFGVVLLIGVIASVITRCRFCDDCSSFS